MSLSKLIKVADYYNVKYSFEEDNENNSFPNYPEDYVPGKTYGRDKLAEIFSNLTGFPYLASREAYFPFLPGGVDWDADPGSMQVYGPEPITIEEFAAKEKNRISSWTEEIVELSFDKLSKETLDFIHLKASAPGFDKRINFQKSKVLANKKNPFSITPENEPIILKEKDGEYSIVEGWHRAITLLTMLKDGEFGNKNFVPARAIVGHEI